MKTGLIIAGVLVSLCCLTTSGLVFLGLFAADSVPTRPPASSTATGGGGKLGGYIIYGKSTPVADGFADSLEGSWMLMDGASVDSIEEIHSDHVVVKTKRSGELWHFTFESGGDYTFRYVISGSYGSVIWVEKGQYTSDGAQLTLSPESCFSKASSEKTECLEPGERTYTLTTVQLEELTPNERVGVTFKGVRLTGPFPSFSQGPNPYSYRELQRVQ